MPTIKSGNKCADCKHSKVWSTDHKKATCNLYNEQGFHPNRTVSAKYIGKVQTKY